MPVTMGGFASGIQTDDIIKKLVDVEAQPIKNIEREKKTYNRKKDTLNKLGSILKKLDKSAKDLYGFRASYDDKKAISSNPEILEAIANNKAEKGKRKIKVLETASTHKIASDPVSDNDKLKSGRIQLEVDGEKARFKFRGGKINKLKEKIAEEFGDSLNVGFVNTYGDKYVMTLESKVPGEKGEILISGDKDLLKSIGLIKGEKGAGKSKIDLTFAESYFTTYSGDKQIARQNGKISVSDKGKTLSMKGKLWRDYSLPAAVDIKKDTVLDFRVKYTEKDKTKADSTTPYRVNFGPEEKTVIKGIELNSYNVSRIRELEPEKSTEKVTDFLGIGVVSIENGQRKEKLYPLEKETKGLVEIPIGADFQGKKISKIVFYNNEGASLFQNAKISTPTKGTGMLQAKNTIAEPSNAKLEVDGVEIIRFKNDGLNNVIKGVTLNLFRANKDQVVTLEVNNDFDKAIKKIKIFVDNYNNYIDFHGQITKAAISKKAGDYKKNKYKNGIMMGDMTVLRLQGSLQRAISSAYPSRLDKPFRMISDIGVSTGRVNASWEEIQKGKLQVDEDQLKKSMASKPDAVRDLFGSDNDGDNRPDNGFAYTINSVLKPYVRSGKNLIANEIDLQDESLKRADERIARLEDHVKSYEEKLRSKFGSMEKAVSGNKSRGNWLKQQSQGGK